MAQGFAERKVVESPLEQQANAPALHAVTPGASVQVPTGSDFSKVGSEHAALSQVLDLGAEFANSQYKEGLKEEFVNGQMAQQQGKDLSEYNKFATSHAFVSGFKSMQAQTLADKAFAQASAEITSGDFQLTPEQYRQKRTEQFKQMLTGDEETDRYITQLSVDVNSKLSKEHTLKHEAWKVDESVNSYRDLVASKASLAAQSDTDAKDLRTLLTNPTSVPGMERINPVLAKKGVAEAIVQSLDSGSDKALETLKEVLGGSRPVSGPTPVEKGNIDLTARPRVKNADGSVSTVRSMSFNDGSNEVLIPTVVDGKVVSNEEAIDNYRKTGQHLGKFNTPEEATAYAEALHTQQEQAYTQKGVAGLEGAGFNKAQLGDIREAWERWNNKEQNKFNLAYETDRESLLDKAKTGEMSREAYLQGVRDLTDKYNKDDRFAVVMAREGLANYGEFSPEVQSLAIKYKDLTRKGASYASVSARLEKDLDAMDATPQTRRALRAMAAEGSEQYKARMEARAEAAYEREQAHRAMIRDAVTAMNFGAGWSLTDQQKTLGFAAFEQGEAQAEKAANNVRGADPTATHQSFSDRLADFTSKQGIVNPVASARWTAAMSANTIGATPNVGQQRAAQEFLTLAQKNPELALDHLKGDTKQLGMRLISAASSGMSLSNAYMSAVDQHRSSLEKAQSSDSLRKSVKSVAKDLISENASGMFFGLGSSGFVGQGARDATAALSSPSLTAALTRKANEFKARGLSDPEAAAQAAMWGKTHIGVVGDNVLVSHTKPISEAVGLGHLSDQASLGPAINRVLKTLGPVLFSTKWKDSEGTTSGPRTLVQYDNTTGRVLVTLYEKDGSLGPTRQLRPSLIRDTFYHNGGEAKITGPAFGRGVIPR